MLDTVPALRGRQVEVGDIDSDSDNDTRMDTDEEGEEEMLDEQGSLLISSFPTVKWSCSLALRAPPLRQTCTARKTSLTPGCLLPGHQQKTKDLINSMGSRLRRGKSGLGKRAGRSKKRVYKLVEHRVITARFVYYVMSAAAPLERRAAKPCKEDARYSLFSRFFC